MGRPINRSWNSQVVSAKQFPKIRAGRNLIVSYFRKEMEAVAEAVEDRKTDTGTMKISSAELTALDLLRYPQASAGIDNITTVLSDLGRRIDADQLATLSAMVERSIIQRLGHLLDRLGHEERSGAMHCALQARGPVPWIELDRGEPRAPDIVSLPRERDARWRVIVRRTPEADD